MEDKTLNNIVENLLFILPVFHKKVFKIDPPGVSQGVHLSRLHIGILGVVHHETLPISEIAKKLLIPKPQMTHLVNQLVGAGMITRQPNRKDRRVTDIAITESGKEILNRCERHLKRNLKELFSSLDEKDQEELAGILQKLRRITSKWESPGRNGAKIITDGSK